MKSDTKKLIEDTFFDLLRKKPLSSISVKEIAETAKISRGTFYLHYNDILSIFDNAVERDLNNYIPSLNTDCFFEKIEEIPLFFRNNRAIIRNLLESKYVVPFLQNLFQLMGTLSKAYIDICRPVLSKNETLYPIITGLLSHEMFGRLIKWLLDDMPDFDSSDFKRMCWNITSYAEKENPPQ